MARIPQDQITDTILKAALQEFYSKGYNNATMDAIAQKAKVPIDLLHSSYETKERLLDAVLDPLLSVWESMLSDNRQEVSSDDKIYLLTKAQTQTVIKLFEYRQEFILLMDKSQGTRYEREKDRFIWKIETGLNRRHKSGFSDPVFNHIIANNFVDGLMKILYHYKGQGWAIMILNKLSEMYLWGISL